MTEKIRVINSGNTTIQYDIHDSDDAYLRRNCVGIMLEIIKASAASGTPLHVIEDSINKIEKNSAAIYKALKNEK